MRGETLEKLDETVDSDTLETEFECGLCTAPFMG